MRAGRGEGGSQGGATMRYNNAIDRTRILIREGLGSRGESVLARRCISHGERLQIHIQRYMQVSGCAITKARDLEAFVSGLPQYPTDPARTKNQSMAQLACFSHVSEIVDIWP